MDDSSQKFRAQASVLLAALDKLSARAAQADQQIRGAAETRAAGAAARIDAARIAAPHAEGGVEALAAELEDHERLQRILAA